MRADQCGEKRPFCETQAVLTDHKEKQTGEPIPDVPVERPEVQHAHWDRYR